MKKRLLFISGMLAAIAGISAASLGNVKQTKAAGDTTYDCMTSIAASCPAATYDGPATTTPFGVEAVNLAEFYTTGQGVTRADANGTLPTVGGDDWSASALSLLTYPMWKNTQSWRLTKFMQYPDGWRMGTIGAAAWPDGTVDASTAYGCLEYSEKYIHPDQGLGIVIYFTAPAAGTVYLTDTVSAPSADSGDGTNFCVYKIPAASFITRTWNSVTHHGLCGGTPIYPSAGVSPTANWTSGWKHIGATAETYYTENFDVAAGDVIAWIYGAGNSSGYDATYTSPKVVYGVSPIDEAADFEENYVYAPGGTPIEYTDGSNTGACLTTYPAAKTAYSGLTDEAKVIFGTEAKYANARARLIAWAEANGETIEFDASGIIIFLASESSALTGADYAPVAIFAIAAAALTSLVFIIRRRKRAR